jgi:hypothetical protein
MEMEVIFLLLRLVVISLLCYIFFLLGKLLWLFSLVLF